MSLFSKSRSPLRGRSPISIRPRLEELETRVVPYTTTGTAWPYPNLITVSFVPDGTAITGNLTSNLFSDMSSLGTTATWQAQFIKAAQTWAQEANINFSTVSDNGTTSGGGNYQQGDPGMGDIRIAGIDFGTTSILAETYLPPNDSNYSISGDVIFNTNSGVKWKIGGIGGYDPYTVAVHEIGHALGLADSTNVISNMYATYIGKTLGLYTDDVQGVQAIYGGRAADSSNSSFLTATDVTGQLDPTALTAVVNNQNLNSGLSADYFTVTAPANTNSTVKFQVQTSGLSLMAPQLTVFAADQHTILLSVSGSGKYGTTITATVNNVTAGQQFYLKVNGTGSPVNDGEYALVLNLGTGSMPAVTLPNTQLLNGNPIVGPGTALYMLAPAGPDFAALQLAGSVNLPGATTVVAAPVPAQGFNANAVATATPPAATINPTVATVGIFVAGGAQNPAAALPEGMPAPAVLPAAVQDGSAVPAGPVTPDAGFAAPTPAAADKDVSGRPQSCDQFFSDALAVQSLNVTETPTVATLTAADVNPAAVLNDGESDTADTNTAKAVLLLPVAVLLGINLEPRRPERTRSAPERP
jgi:hypothetical protein